MVSGEVPPPLWWALFLCTADGIIGMDFVLGGKQENNGEDDSFSNS